MEYYYIGRACLKGHGVDGAVDPVNVMPMSAYEFRTDEDQRDPEERFCSRCGETTIVECTQCHAPIRGYPKGLLTGKEWVPAPFCYHCGSAYPWTQSRLRAAEVLLGELEELDEQDVKVLSGSLRSLIAQEAEPDTELVVHRWKRVMLRVKQPTREILIGIVSGLATEFIKTKFNGE